MADITLSPEQAEAVRAIVEWYKGGDDTPQVFRLFGYAGTGKSTLANYAIEELRAEAGVKQVRTGTFTGKAANVLRKKGVADASTIHAMIYIPMEDPETGQTTFVRAPEGPASDADLIVLDEVSMVNREMADDVLAFRKKVLVMGDPGQLPPVNGQGAFNAGEPDVMLTEIHRQALDSPILRLATMARLGKPLPWGEWEDPRGNVSMVLPHTAENQGRLYRPETQAICGIHRVRWGYTGRIRQRLGFEGALPLPGETVICCKNDRDLGVFNGGFGKMLTKPRELADGTHWRMSVEMEDLPNPIKGAAVHPWLFQQHSDRSVVKPRVSKGILEFDWGYVITCHKAQGSEWPDVTIVDDGGSFREDQHKWRYTAITRASESVTFLRRAA